MTRVSMRQSERPTRDDVTGFGPTPFVIATAGCFNRVAWNGRECCAREQFQEKSCWAPEINLDCEIIQHTNPQLLRCDAAGADLLRVLNAEQQMSVWRSCYGV